MEKYNIIASIAKIDNKNENQNLEVIGSFVKYKNPIDFDKIMKTSSFLSQKTDFFLGNEFLVLYLTYWKSYDGGVKISEANPKVKIIELNIFKFVQAIKEDMSLNLHKVLNTKTELKKSEMYRDDSELFSLKNFLLRDSMKNINVILIFDTITLSNFYILLKTLGITIYGGPSQRRHLLSTVHKSLVMFLQLLDNMAISPDIIYESYTDVAMSKGKYVNKIGRLIDNVRNSKDSEEIQKNMSILNEYTELVSEEYDFVKKFNDLLGFYITITQYYFILIRNKNELIGLTEKVENHRPKIKSLNSEIQKTEEDIRFLVQSMYKLDNDYFNEQGEFIYDPDIKIDLNNVKSSLGENTKYSKINTLNQKRDYSTFVRNNSCHNIRSNIFNNNKRYLYTNNSIISNKIMELLYSDNNKEVVQRNIEKYLMNEQNNYILDRVSSTPINYSLLSNEISSKIIGSVKDLKKLHKNSLGIDIFGKDSKFNKVLRTLEFDYITHVVFGRLITILSYNDIANKYTYVTEVAFNLGRDLVFKYNYIQYKSDPSYNSFSIFCEENSDQIISLDEVTNIVQLGNVLIGWLKELKLITSRVEVIDHKEKRSILIVGDEIKDLLLKQEQVVGLINLPGKLPMIVPPKKINYRNDGKLTLGGYLLNDEEFIEPLIIDNPQLASKSEIEQKNIITDMVNNANSVAFSINEEVLDFILKYRKEYNLFMDFEYKHPLSSKKKLNIYEKKELESFISKQNLEMEILNIANIFRNTNELYFPVRLDYRGRIYCTVESLNYQGIELAKALLKFSKGEEVYLNDELSINYLKIYGANCWGNKLEKESFVTRINWVDSNIDDIINFENGVLLSKAENKLLFIAFCFEFNKYINAVNRNSKFFISHLPVQLDATSNGFQHLCLILKDSTLAKKVNLSKSTWDDSPDDFYSFLSLRIKQYFEDQLNNNKDLLSDQKDSYERLGKLDFQNHRTLVKKTIMTIPYNATVFSNIKNMKEDFKYDYKENHYVYTKDPNIIFKEYDFKFICRALYICLYRDFPKLEALFLYFKEIGKIANKLGLHIPWTLPSGLSVKQKFWGTKKIKLKPFIYTKDLLNLNIYDKESSNKLKQIRALMPNIIHSLDAASLALLIDRFFKLGNGRNFYAVHDCFGVTCNNVHLISELLKLIYVDIYCSNRFLINFDENFRKTIKNQYGEDSFIEENKIQFINEFEEIIEINYPNINFTLNPEKLNFKESSYSIH